jgi:hypothetical protein
MILYDGCSDIVKVLGVGERFLRLGLNPAAAQAIPVIVQCVTDDSFRANAVVFREIRGMISAQQSPRHLALNMKCAIHLGNLIRKSLVLSINGYWTTVVRLGHLFELSRFRRSFVEAMRSVIQSSFSWVPVFALPAGMPSWSNQTLELLGLWADEPGSKVTNRYSKLMNLIAA